MKKYVMDETLSWEERYKQLEAHHIEETQWLYAYKRAFENLVARIDRDGGQEQSGKTLEENLVRADRKVAELNVELDDRKRLLAMPVEHLALSVRSTNCLQLAGIRTVGDLTRRLPAEMMKIPNFGMRSLREVSNELGLLGLRLKQPWRGSDD